MIIEKILNSVKYIRYEGQYGKNIIEPSPINEIHKNDNYITWCSEKNIDHLKNIKSESIIILNIKTYRKLKGNFVNFLIVENPRYTFKEILKLFDSDFVPKISISSKIHNSVKVGKNVFIGHNVVIEEGSVINDNVVINHNSVIYRNSIIENNVIIGSNCSIGNSGFGYEKNEQGENEKIPHLGNVVLKANVEIGDNVCIDRAVMGSTLIGENVKIDNLTHISHGVKVGKNSTILANVVIAGSVEIGDNCWISFGVSILNKVIIGKNCILGINSTILKSFKDNLVILGSPGKIFKKNI